MAAAGKKGRAGKSTSARRGKVDQGFSDDPLISALQVSVHEPWGIKEAVQLM